MTQFGLPYASGKIVDGKLVRICPVCLAECPEQTDQTGELKTNTYAEHYEASHQN